jgi:hypothetical protein
MKSETCENCGSEIGKIEKVFVYEDHITCAKCYSKLKGTNNNTHQSANVKLGKVTAIAGMRLGAGICNIIAGVVFCWLIFPIPMIALGIVELISASNLFKEKPKRPSNFKVIPILEIVAIITLAGWISVVVGIVTLVFLADPKVENYLNCLEQ